MAQAKTVNGILLLYHRPPVRDASTVMEHVASFRRYSEFRVWPVNTALGFPRRLREMRFRVIALHYSLMGFTPDSRTPVGLGHRFLDYLRGCDTSYKLAFFQDEHHYCQQRFALINQLRIDCVYTLLQPQYVKDVYGRYTCVPKVATTLTGYVSDTLLAKAQRYAKPDSSRKIDVGYRGRRLAPYMGKGALEKYEIALRFREAAAESGLRINIETEERERLYGDAWYRFLGDCKACLGVEAGVSIFDIEDVVRQEYDQLIVENPGITLEEMSERLLNHWEGNIPYRTVSPRHFEAAAFRVCQILYEGDYQGIMKPMVHYIPLKKDLSNFDEVIDLFHHEDFRHQITENCYRDLIASGRYSYREFIAGFDRELLKAGLAPQITVEEETRVSAAMSRDRARRWFLYLCLRGLLFIGRAVMSRPILRRMFRVWPLVNIYALVVKWLER